MLGGQTYLHSQGMNLRVDHVLMQDRFELGLNTHKEEYFDAFKYNVVQQEFDLNICEQWQVQAVLFYLWYAPKSIQPQLL